MSVVLVANHQHVMIDKWTNVKILSDTTNTRRQLVNVTLSSRHTFLLRDVICYPDKLWVHTQSVCCEFESRYAQSECVALSIANLVQFLLSNLRRLDIIDSVNRRREPGSLSYVSPWQ
jgi:hypothetical protein